MKKKKSKKTFEIIILIIIFILCLIGIFKYIYDNTNWLINNDTIENTYVISRINDDYLVVISSKWIQDKINATEAGLLDYYNAYFNSPTSGKDTIIKEDIPIKDEKGHKITWDDLRPGDEILVIRKRNALYNAILGPMQNVESIKLKQRMKTKNF